ncbi:MULTISPECIES: DUF6497 family protein [unclassified Sulfitobacter]|uniref:DUF6497 family protein n=1 Tax=unclassified Sulfitobacter TaxID=196795 RepID=UPI0023E1F9DE|nr:MULTISPECIES: DUF6497 family protein [unclassified Sulfitobacter]
MKAILAAFLLAASPALAADVPSGQPVTLHEVLVDAVESETWLRFRFIAPDIARAGRAMAYDVAAEDMMHLCTALALPYSDTHALAGDMIIISLADRVTEFGVPAPEATQFFEAFRPVDNTCIWESL